MTRRKNAQDQPTITSYLLTSMHPRSGTTQIAYQLAQRLSEPPRSAKTLFAQWSQWPKDAQQFTYDVSLQNHLCTAIETDEQLHEGNTLPRSENLRLITSGPNIYVTIPRALKEWKEGHQPDPLTIVTGKAHASGLRYVVHDINHTFPIRNELLDWSMQQPFHSRALVIDRPMYNPLQTSYLLMRFRPHWLIINNTHHTHAANTLDTEKTIRQRYKGQCRVLFIEITPRYSLEAWNIYLDQLIFNPF